MNESVMLPLSLSLSLIFLGIAMIIYGLALRRMVKQRIPPPLTWDQYFDDLPWHKKERGTELHEKASVDLFLRGL